jgi:hypothetical protein
MELPPYHRPVLRNIVAHKLKTAIVGFIIAFINRN